MAYLKQLINLLPNKENIMKKILCLSILLLIGSNLRANSIDSRQMEMNKVNLLYQINKLVREKHLLDESTASKLNKCIHEALRG
jgi:hypothetical protein